MSLLPAETKDAYVFFPEKSLVEVAKNLKEQYQGAAPFPHIVIDDFLPTEILEKALAEFPPNIIGEQRRDQEIYKGLIEPDNLATGYSRQLFYSFNSRPFLSFLEELTGIEGLIPDPYFLGGGFHETRRGGKLGIHADFNLHKKLKLLRRINVLIYLNKEWDEGFGGNLELWDREMKRSMKSVSPIFNRCVIFNTDDDSYHGHPDPLQCPDTRTRKSIALYYYTASDAIFHERKTRTTVFKVRPKSGDKFDYYIRGKYFIRDLIPPILTRVALKALKSKNQ